MNDGSARASGPEVSVLVVDDDPALADLAQTHLSRTNEAFTVETETSATAALDRLETEWFDCIISDFQMPDTNGLEFLEAVRTDFSRHVPFIIFTGRGREEVAIDALNLGADGYVQKGGQPEAQFGVLADRVARAVREQRTLAELHEQERRLSMVEELADVGIIDWHLDTGDIYASANLRRMYQLPADRPLSIDDFEDIMHPDDRETVQTALDDAITGDGTYNLEHRILLNDGTVLWTKNHARLVEDEVGNRSRLLGVVHDITELKEMQETLRQFIEDI